MAYVLEPAFALLAAPIIFEATCLAVLNTLSGKSDTSAVGTLGNGIRTARAWQATRLAIGLTAIELAEPVPILLASFVALRVRRSI